MSVSEVLVLGGGLAGLATAANLGERAVVLERNARPGGLVRTVEIDGWWFDRVIHLLYFSEEDTKARVSKLLGNALAPCEPLAFVVTEAGVARYPIQEHLGHLKPDVAAACLADIVHESHMPRSTDAGNYREVLQRSFGKSLCDLFFFPYNEKMWRRQLNTLAPSGFVWNLARPGPNRIPQDAVRTGNANRVYNADGWFPRPAADSPIRGMEVLSAAVASEVHDLRLNHEVTSIDPLSRTVKIRVPGGEVALHWGRKCVASLPLPRLISLCSGVPDGVGQAARLLRYNRVLSVAMRIEGPRPNLGLWRYYPALDISFTRLIFLHAFDPLMAPARGWPLLAEVPWRCDTPVPADVAERAVCDARRVGALGPNDNVLDATVLEADPAYVVFDSNRASAVEVIRSWLQSVGIEVVGRYGRWEYSSMAQVLRDGYSLGKALAAELAQT
jgi:protoporphyrinogen oxidase